MSASTEPRMVRLQLCTRRSCQHLHPTLEAAQQAAVARATELVEGTLAILKPR